MDKEEFRKEAQESYIKLLRQINCKQDYNCETFNDGYLAGVETREKRIKELEESLLDIAKQSAKQIDELKKENTELKGKNKWYSEQVCNKECAEVWGNLDKAKEIINKLIELVEFLNGDNVKEPIIAEAEQFIKDSEVEK